MSALITTVLFSSVAAGWVYLVGRRDPARDPQLTGWALGWMLLYPLAAIALPKWIPISSSAGELPSTTAILGDAGWYALWGAGCAMVSARLLIAAWVVRSWRRRSLLLERRDRVEIRLSPQVGGPVAVGVRHPVIYVPRAWLDWSEETRRIVIAHETAHHSRKDPMLRWIAEIACAVNWFNPLVWWMARRLVMQCEFACDAEVISKGVQKNHYVGVLCDLAICDRDAGPIAAMATKSSLEKRVIRLSNNRELRALATCPLLRCWIFGGALTLCGTALAMMGPRAAPPSPVPQQEAQIRWSANPFPGEPP